MGPYFRQLASTGKVGGKVAGNTRGLPRGVLQGAAVKPHLFSIRASHWHPQGGWGREGEGQKVWMTLWKWGTTDEAQAVPLETGEGHRGG